MTVLQRYVVLANSKEAAIGIVNGALALQEHEVEIVSKQLDIGLGILSTQIVDETVTDVAHVPSLEMIDPTQTNDPGS